MFFKGVLITIVFVLLAMFKNSCLASITIDNYTDGDVQHYPYALLCGRVEEPDSDWVVIENLSSSSPDRIVRVQVVTGRFKALVKLSEGANRLTIASQSSRIDFSIVFRRSRNPYFVRIVLFTDCDDTVTDFTKDFRDIPGVLSHEELSARLSTKLRNAASLWQIATAEQLHNDGYGRKTFRLEHDENGEVIVWRQRGRESSRSYLQKSQEERFQAIRREIITGSLSSSYASYFVLLAFSQPEEVESIRTALGAGRVGVLDARCLFTWPDDVNNLGALFSDCTPIPSDYLRDSAFRNTRWALSSSSLGAGLHELGHALGMEHTNDPLDCMSRGFDFFNRLFSVEEPEGDSENFHLPHWNKKNAEILMRSLWIEE
ncbi:MAG: hypothetical protein Q4G03_07975 [Planctomycetia bacterium]|nr:hypothetical protein [Planctomycetia bacterium]